MAAFDRAQGSGAPAGPATGAASGAAQSASTQVYGIVGTPDRLSGSGVGGYINGLLGGTS
jgi:hypothetical protein